jgi:hypothetical protein
MSRSIRWTLPRFIAVLQRLAAAPAFHTIPLTDISRLPAFAARTLEVSAPAEHECASCDFYPATVNKCSCNF